MKAEIISIGDELLIGQVVNTNQAYIAIALNSVGIYADKMTTVGDNMDDILSVFDKAYKTHDLVTVTGGLGPTHDDITREAVCKYFNTELILDEESLENIKRIFDRRKIPLTKMNQEQALVPKGCTVIKNKLGTAPGYFFNKPKYFIVMPGVPYEMQAMMEDFVIPYFKENSTGSAIVHRTIKTTGIPESLLAEQIGDIKELLCNQPEASLAFLPSSTGVRLRLTARSTNNKKANDIIKTIEDKIVSKVKKYIYAYDDLELEEVVGNLLREKKLTLAIAESCTGGLIADKITNIPGCSEYFMCDVISYSNNSKIYELGVDKNIINTYGAVSKETAERMAIGIRKKANVDIAISVTGIAGPSGGSLEKPVGLVWIGYSDAKETFARQYNFGGDRRIIKERASQSALELIRQQLIK